MNPYQTNFIAYKYAESNLEALNSICHPLSMLNIKVFAYFRFFQNGKYMYLCNNLDWVRFCLQNIHNNEGTELGKEIGYVPEDNYHCFLWPTKKTDYLMSALYDFNIWNGLSIFKQREDSIELWGFAADRKTETLRDFYIQNIDLLKDFTTFFNVSAADFICPDDNRLAVYKDFKQFDSTVDEYKSNQIAEFIKKTSTCNYPLMVNNQEVFLTKKELMCLNWLSSGKNAKQIALQLDLSYRTIEKNLESIKIKTGCHDKESIIKIYQNSILQWL